jgi:DNA integrity scanning protein DisA with diadenylate cyclase activity
MDFNSDTLEMVLAAAAGAVVALIAVYVGFRKGVKGMAEALPGEDFFERLDKKLTAKVDPVIDAIERGVDKLNPNTHGGPGQGPDVKQS